MLPEFLVTNFFTVKSLVKVLVTNLKPTFAGKIDTKIATKDPPHFSLSQTQIPSPRTSGNAFA